MLNYRTKYSEFELQALLYDQLRSQDIDVKGEVYWRMSNTYCRLDLVIYENRKPICIIEVKRNDYYWDKTEAQMIKYEEAFNLPVLLFNDISQMSFIMSEIQKCIKGIYNKEEFHTGKEQLIDTQEIVIQKLLVKHPILLEY